MPEIVFSGIPNKIGGSKILSFHVAIREAVASVKPLDISKESVMILSEFKDSRSKKGISIIAKVVPKPEINEQARKSLEKIIKNVVSQFFPKEKIVGYEFAEN